MKKLAWVGLGAVFLACGGAGAALSAATSNKGYSGDTTSTVSFTADAQNKIDLSMANAFAQIDPVNKQVVILVFEPGSNPPPSCDRFATSASDLKAGGVVMLMVKNFPARGMGTFPIAFGQFVDLQQGMQGHGDLDGVTIEIDQHDSNWLLGHLRSASSAKMIVTGEIQATLCPDGSIPASTDTSDAGADSSASPTTAVADAGDSTTATPAKKTKKKKH